MQRRRAGEVNGKFNQASSFKSIRTGSESSVLPSTWTDAEGTGLNVVRKLNFSWASPRFQALMWVLATK